MVSPTVRICPGVKGKRCKCFLSNESRDLHPTCVSYRVNAYEVSFPCNICAVWDEGHWAPFHGVHVGLAFEQMKKGEHRLARTGARGKHNSSFLGFSGGQSASTSSPCLSVFISYVSSSISLPSIFWSTSLPTCSLSFVELD